MSERDEIERLREQLANAQANAQAREDRIAVLTAKIKDDTRPIQPGEPGYDDEHGDQGKQEDRLADLERGRAFLERLREQRFGDDWDLAYLALDDVIRLGCAPKTLTEQVVCALGRVLRESE